MRDRQAMLSARGALCMSHLLPRSPSSELLATRSVSLHAVFALDDSLEQLETLAAERDHEETARLQAKESTSGLTAEQLNQLPRHAPSSCTAGDDTCSICLSTFSECEESCCTLPCCHTYHHACIVQWLTVSSSCPLCKAPVVDSAVPSVCAVGSSASLDTQHAASSPVEPPSMLMPGIPESLVTTHIVSPLLTQNREFEIARGSDDASDWHRSMHSREGSLQSQHRDTDDLRNPRARTMVPCPDARDDRRGGASTAAPPGAVAGRGNGALPSTEMNPEVALAFDDTGLEVCPPHAAVPECPTTATSVAANLEQPRSRRPQSESTRAQAPRLRTEQRRHARMESRHEPTRMAGIEQPRDQGTSNWRAARTASSEAGGYSEGLQQKVAVNAAKDATPSDCRHEPTSVNPSRGITTPSAAVASGRSYPNATSRSRCKSTSLNRPERKPAQPLTATTQRAAPPSDFELVGVAVPVAKTKKAMPAAARVKAKGEAVADTRG